MSFKEVTELRKSGQLTQAYNMALADLNASHSDVWSCRAMFWVLYDMSSRLIEQKRFDNIADFLKQFNWVYERLRGMGAIDEIATKSAAVLLRKVLNALLDFGRTVQEVLDIFEHAGYHSIDEIFENIRLDYFFKLYNATQKHEGNPHQIVNEYASKFQNSQPSDNHSKFLASVLWIYRADDDNENAQFIRFFDAWGINNLQDSDWKSDNSDYDPVAIKVLNRVFAYLSKTRYRDLNKYFALFQDAYIKKRLDFHLRRKYAILLIHRGEKNQAIEIYKQLLRQKQDFYLYSELAELVENIDAKMSLYSMALLRQRKDEFVGAIHLQMAQLFIEKGLLREASTELNIYKVTYERNKWKLNEKYTELASKVDITQFDKNNQKLYAEYAGKNNGYAKLPDKSHNKQSRPNKVENSGAQKEFEGELKYKQKDGRAFAFVGDCYISAKLLEQQGITQNCSKAKVQARQLPDGKWQATKILEIEK